MPSTNGQMEEIGEMEEKTMDYGLLTVDQWLLKKNPDRPGKISLISQLSYWVSIATSQLLHLESRLICCKVAE
jgi:hypothetical protein